MKLELGKCYILTTDGVGKRFRVIMRDKFGAIKIRDCDTKQEEDFIIDTNQGGFSEDFTLVEFDCMECDGKPSL